MNRKQKLGILFAITAAALYAISSPFSKLLLNKVQPTMLAALLYLGAGLGITLVNFTQKIRKEKTSEIPLSKKDLPYIIGMVVLDIFAPIFLMVGLTMTTAANVSLLNNFEIVATSIIALLIFKENVSKRLWIAIALVTLSSIILSINDGSAFSFSMGSLFVILACICWGFENNCTRTLSSKNPLHIVIIKGFFSGLGSLLIAFICKEKLPDFKYIIITLLLGFIAYGLSIMFYIYAQRNLGAAKTSTYYAIAPFIGTGLSLIIFKDTLTITFIIGLLIMIVGTYFASTDTKHKKIKP